ncbi:MAG: hypothetical protein DRQ03_01095 [Candidatus Hydrothermota bacterium]|nr:MAG: hypothetical protein DRQ03_01095 [Candidatus Hydrothermae bacterium]
MRLVKCLVVVGIAGGLLSATPTIDGTINPASEGWQVASYNPNASGYAGADLDTLYYYMSSDSLYLAIKTQNSASWDVAYGFGIDVNQEQDNGYVGNASTGTWDAWGRHLIFPNASPDYYAPDYEVYFWWEDDNDAITSVNLCTWTGSGWNFNSTDVTYATSGDGNTGLISLEFRISWSMLGSPERILVSTWIAGGDNSSAVDALPQAVSVTRVGDSDPTVTEWTDVDTLDQYVSITTPLGISEVSIRNFDILPAVGGFVIKGEGVFDYVIYTVDGREITRGSVRVSGEKKISLGLTPGLYIFKEKRGGHLRFIVIR